MAKGKFGGKSGGGGAGKKIPGFSATLGKRGGSVKMDGPCKK